jgi:hypothetical protein
LTACYFTKQKDKTIIDKNIMPRPILFANALLAAIIITGMALVNFLPGTLGKKDKTLYGEGDFTLDMYGWKKSVPDFSKIIDGDIKNGLVKPGAVIICNKWFPAAHIDFYVALPLHKDLVAIGDTNDIHQYAWINTQRKTLQPGDDAYCIVPSNYYADVQKIYAAHFATILSPQIIEQKRNGMVCRYFYLWRLKHFIQKQNPLLQ